MRLALLVSLMILLFPSPALSGWAPDGIPLTRAPMEQAQPLIAKDDAGGAFIAWLDAQTYGDGTSGGWDVFLQHVTAAGGIAPGWPIDGLLIVSAPHHQGTNDLIPDGAGGVLVAWWDSRSDEGDVYLQRITAGGAVAPGWPAGGLPVCTAPGLQDFIMLASDGDGGAYVSWQDRRPGVNAGYWLHVLGDGTPAPGWPENGLPFAPGPILTGRPVLLPDGAGGVLATWAASNDPTLSTSFILGQHLLSSGEVTPGWPPGGVVVCNEQPQSRGPAAIVTDGTGGFYAEWEDWRADPFYNDADVYAQHVTAGGAVAAGWPADGLPLVVQRDLQWDSRACEDGRGGLFVGWEDYRDIPERAYLIHVGPGGERLSGWPQDGLAFNSLPGFQLDMNLVPDGFGGVYVTWNRYTDYYKVMVHHLTGNGTPASGWSATGLALASTPGDQDLPVITDDGVHGAIVSWADSRNGNLDIYAQRVVNDGLVAVEISLVSAEATPSEVHLRWFAAAAPGLLAAVYRRDEQGDWARLGTVSADGSGNLDYVDRAITPGARYAYRLGVASDSGERFTAETWVEVPVMLRLALEGLRPNPANGPLQAAFTLPGAAPAMLELLDVSGRRVLAREVGALGAGRHLIRLDGDVRVPAGLYWLRLTQSSESRITRGAVIR